MNILDAFKPQVKSAPPFPNRSIIGGWPSTSYSAQRQSGISEAYADIHFVYEIVHDIASAGSVLPLKVFTISPMGDREESHQHPAYQLLRSPNPVMTRSYLWEFSFSSRLLWGEWFLAKVPRDPSRLCGPSNPPVELWPVRPDRMEEVADPETGQLLGWFMRTSTSSKVAIAAEDVIHNRTYHPSNDYRGMPPIQALRYEIELGRDAEGTAIDLYKNGLFARGVLQVSKRAGAETLKQIASQFREMMIGSANRWRVPVLEEGMEFKALQMSPEAAQWLDTVKLPRQRVASAYGYPLVELHERATPAELHRLKYAGAVQPLTVSAEESLEKFLMANFSDSAFPEFQLSHVLDADFPTLIGAYKDAIYSGQMTPNDARKKLNLPAKEGGDDLLIPLNMERVSALSNPSPEPVPNDSSGGMGGDQGKPQAGTGSNALTVADHKALIGGYGRVRERRIGKLAQALDNRVRGVLKREAASVKTGKAVVMPTADSLEALIAASTPEMARIIRQFAEQAAAAGAEDASSVTGQVFEPDLAQLFAERAPRVAAQFSDARVADLLAALQAGGDPRDFMNAVSDLYGAKFSSYAERLSRTETAYAHETAANGAWRDAGATGVTWNFGGGPCTTGVCEELDQVTVGVNDGFDGLDGTIDGPPAHGSCTCFTTPDFAG